MSKNPFLGLFQNLKKISNSIQSHLSTFIARPVNLPRTDNNALFSVSSSSKPSASSKNFETFRPEEVLKKDSDGNWYVGAMATVIDDVGVATVYCATGNVKAMKKLAKS